MPLDPDLFGESPHSSHSFRHRDTSTNFEEDEDGTRIVTFSDISAAAFRIVNAVQRTPCVTAHLSEMFNMNLHFKMEQMQCTGSVCERAARYVLMTLTPEQREAGVITASDGNFALALSHHGCDMEVPVKIVMPTSAAIMKVSGCRENHAEVILHGMTSARV